MYFFSNYLPQFHETETNNTFYVKGYTEWTAVKNAVPYFNGHNQPRIPYNKCYYSLLDKNVLKWQAEMAKKYGIDGFAFYHYYFDTNRLELEKPAEILLENKDVHMNFFFVWANESWGRRKDKKNKSNQWTNLYDNNHQGDVFITQKYNGIEQYRKHYEYVYKFICDDRYIKIEGRPVFAIYDTSHIENISEMMECWNNWSIADGLYPFYFIGINNWEHEKLFDANLFQAPNAAYHIGVPTVETNKGIIIKDYEDVMEKILSLKSEPKRIFGTFVDFDNTPRYGNKHGLIIRKKSRSSFELYLREIVKKNVDYNYTFINAWNEWGEGNYLEADTDNGFGYLEAISRVKRGLNVELSIIIPVYNTEKYLEQCLDSILMQIELSFEIICVNDGSSDGSMTIIENYQKRYPDLIIVYDGVHLGVSEARNIGLRMALGKYIYYIDADDYLKPNAFSVMRNVIKQYPTVDVYFFSFENVCNDNELSKKYADMISKKKRNNDFAEAIDGISAFSQMWSNREYYPLVWLQLTRREFLESVQVKFMQDIVYEDQLYTFQILKYAHSVMCFKEEIYNKRIRKNSICTGEKKLNYIISYLKIYWKVKDEIKELEVSDQMMELLDSYIIRIRREFIHLSDEEKELLYGVLKKEHLMELIDSIITEK